MTGSSWANVCQSRSFHCLPPSRCDFWIKSKSWRLLFYMFGVESLICSLIAICICIRGFMVQRKCFLRPCFKRQRAKRWSLFTGHPALLLQGSLLLCPPSLSHFLPHSLLTLLPSEPLYISASLSLRGCHFLLSPSPFLLCPPHSSLSLLFKCLLPTFSLCISPSDSTSSASALLSLRASKQANSHAALLSQYNEIWSTQIERSHFLQLSTFYRRGTRLIPVPLKAEEGERSGWRWWRDGKEWV